MLTIAGPKRSSGGLGARGDERVSQLHAVTLCILVKVSARVPGDGGGYRNTG